MQKRYWELDSLRGLAASSVVLHHTLLALPVFWAAHRHQQEGDSVFIKVISDTPLHMFWAGHEAVILFFILSGFVLTLLFNSKKEPYSSYLIGRFCRIYLPYIFSIAVSLSLMNLFLDRDQSNLSDWFNGMWSHSVSFKELISYIFMLGYDSHNINTVTWSLIHEMRISVIFPIIVYLIYRFNWKMTLPLGLLICFLMYGTLSVGLRSITTNGVFDVLLESFGSTAYYCAFFVIGALIARYKESLSAFYKKINRNVKLILIISSVGLYTCEWWVPSIGDAKYSGNFIANVFSRSLIDYGVAGSVIILFLFALNSPKTSLLLNTKAVLFLGKISYSLYLIHPIVILLMFNIFIDSLSTLTLIVLIPLISVVFATLMYYLVEEPSIKAGRYFKKFSLKTKVFLQKANNN